MGLSDIVITMRCCSFLHLIGKERTIWRYGKRKKEETKNKGKRIENLTAVCG